MNHAIEMEIQQEAVENAAAGGDDHSSLAVKNDTSVDDGEDIEKREYAPYAACNIDDGRDNTGVRQKLSVGKPNEVLCILKNNCIDKSEKIDSSDQQKVGSLNKPEISLGLLDLDEYGCT